MRVTSNVVNLKKDSATGRYLNQATKTRRAKQAGRNKRPEMLQHNLGTFRCITDNCEGSQDDYRNKKNI